MVTITYTATNDLAGHPITSTDTVDLDFARQMWTSVVAKATYRQDLDYGIRGKRLVVVTDNDVEIWQFVW